jgi:hypothetical protein
MATNFPGGIDTFVNPNATSSLDSPSHAGLHTDMGDAMTAVQTELVNNPIGLVLIKTTSFSAVSSINLPNVFSADYDNYLIRTNNLLGSTTNFGSIRLSAGGVSNTGNNYTLQRILANSTTISGSRATSSSWFAFAQTTTEVNSGEIVLQNPFLATPTYGWTQLRDDQHTTNIRINLQTLYMSQSVSYDGIEFIPNTGTITGSISVYGYKK